MKLFSLAMAPVFALALSPAFAQPTGEEIVQQCDLNTNIGEDTRSTLTVTLKDADGGAETYL